MRPWLVRGFRRRSAASVRIGGVQSVNVSQTNHVFTANARAKSHEEFTTPGGSETVQVFPNSHVSTPKQGFFGRHLNAVHPLSFHCGRAGSRTGS